MFLRVNGKVDASNGADMHTQLFSGHIPMLLHPSPKRVLIIGLGSGVTAGAVAQYPVDHIDIIEIEPAVIEASRFFETENRSVLKDPRVSMIVADGRNFLLNTRVPYDIIISEPSNPWIRGLASLFSQEFFALAQSRLAPGGIMLQWIQGYSISTDDLRMVAATFRTAFPHSTMWFTNEGDNFLVGTKSSLAALLTRVQERFRASPLLREDFTRVGLSNPVGFLADYLLSEEELGRYAVSADLNTDDTLWLEFSAPRSLYELRNAEMNHRVLRSYRTTDLPPMLPADRLVVDTAEGRDALGRALVGKGLAAEAEAQFTRAGGLDPLHVPSRLDEARLLIQHGMAMKALGALEQVLNRNRHEARAHFLKGEAYRQQGLAEQALAAYERAVAEAPENLDYRLRMAEALKAQGAMEKARREYETANHLKPRSVEVLFPLAELCLAQGKPDDALGTLQPLFAAFPKYPLSTRARIQQLAGFAHLRAKRFVEAIQALEAAAALNPLDTGIRLDLAQAYEAAGKPERALTTLDRLLAIDPGHLLALQRFNALRARLEMGQL